MPVSLPIEVQLEVFRYVASSSPSTLTAVLLLSKVHNRLATPLLYGHISSRDPVSLNLLVQALKERPTLTKHVRSFFFRGPQARRVTGENPLTLLSDDCPDGNDDRNGLQISKLQSEEIDEMRRLGLEPGIEGEGQESTFDVHESVMLLCTTILRLCSSTLQSVGFVDCVPWFLAPAEGGTLNFPLPACEHFTGVTVGLFGLLPHLEKSGQWNEDGTTSLQRVHLIGGDFGSFALQRALIASPSAQTVTHLHITAPSLYRSEQYEHLVAHIRNLLDHLPVLERLTVGIIRWHPPPPPKQSGQCSIDESAAPTGPDDDRLMQCRRAYMHALPQALLQCSRDDVRVGIVRLPFSQGSPAGFAGWIMKHHRRDAAADRALDISVGDTYRKVWLHLWNKRDHSKLAPEIGSDGTPRQQIWDMPIALEWCKHATDGAKLRGGEEITW